jgi:hypothetical protein
MRIFKTKPFARFATKEGIADAALRDAIAVPRLVWSMPTLAAV